MNSLLIQKLDARATIPARSNETDAGLDLASCEAAVIGPWMTGAVNTGIAIAVPSGTYGRIAPRSGLALNQSIDILGGVIDPGYTGPIKVILANHSSRALEIQPGHRIAQLILEMYSAAPVQEVHSLEATARGALEFESTGKCRRQQWAHRRDERDEWRTGTGI